MELIKSVFDISKEFMRNPQYVYVSDSFVSNLSYKMLKERKTKFPTKENKQLNLARNDILYELVANSINYCYWYGKDTIRPGGASATLMYKLVDNCFKIYDFGRDLIDILIIMLTRNRFPLLEERIKHLHEILENGESYVDLFFTNNTYDDKLFFNQQTNMFEGLICAFPGYASDIFLKRASLFFLQLYRRFGVCKQLISKLHVPADYQVPKMLKHFNCISYPDSLRSIINSNQIIPKGSIIECEIRAATVIACQKLVEETGWNISEIDAWLWLRRKECENPFHLTITTDY